MVQPDDRPPAGGLLHHLLTLTTTERGGCFLLPTPAVADSFYFRKWGSLCCPDFPLLRLCAAATEPRHCFQPTAKLHKFADTQKQLHAIFSTLCMAILRQKARIGGLRTMKYGYLPSVEETSSVVDISHAFCGCQKLTPKLSDRQRLCDVSNSSWQMFDRPMSYVRSA